MAILGRNASSRGASPYEVRCPRCEVTFPVEQKVCMHCGGPTGPPGEVFSGDAKQETGFSETWDALPGTRDGYSIEDAIDSSTRVTTHTQSPPPSESPFSIGEGPNSTPVDLEADSSGQGKTVFGSLLQSMGGLIWVLLVIGFSLARSCGE